MPIKERALRHHVNQNMTDGEYAHTIAKALKKLQDGFYDDWWVNCIFQKYERNEIDIYDAHAFSQINAQAAMGEIVMCKIRIGNKPVADKAIELNNKMLQGLDGITAEFWGGTQGSDGYVNLDDPLELDVIDIDGNQITESHEGRFPLEVGYTTGAKTLIYLMPNYGGRIARWPYWEDTIYLLARTKSSMDIRGIDIPCNRKPVKSRVTYEAQNPQLRLWEKDGQNN